MFNFWKSRTEQGAPRCVLLGLDCSGKTTLLYMWHSGRPVTTIPTIGFNLETIRHAGRTLQVLDFGGCDKLAPMVRHYLDSSTGILFLHALNLDSDRIDQSIELLQMHVRQLLDTNGKYMWIMLTKQDLVQHEELDSKRVQAVNVLREAMREFEGNIEWRIFDERGLSALDWVKMWPVFDDVAEKLTNQGVTSKKVTIERIHDEEQLRRKIMREEIDDEPVDTFWEQFLTADLPRWNHRNHLRAGFVMLLKSASMLEDFWTAVDAFLHHIDRLRSTRPDRFRNTSHRTMTTFWLYALQLAILKFRDQDVITHRLPRDDQFQGILLANPQLADPGYWEDYYSRVVMFTPEAKGNWCLPDKKPLLTNFQPTAKVKSYKVRPMQHQPSVVDTKTKTSDGENQTRYLAFAISVVQEYLLTGERRGKVIATALARLQKSTLGLRASSPSSNIAPYSETQAYFWVQIVHATLLPFHQNRLEQSRADSKDDSNVIQSIRGSTPALDYFQFQHIFRLSSDTWRKYYSWQVWNSIDARMSFVNPDLHALPNVFTGPEGSTVAERFLEAKDSMLVQRGNQPVDGVKIERDLRYSGRTLEETRMKIDAVVASVEAILRQMTVNATEGTADTIDKPSSDIEFCAIPGYHRFLALLFVSLQQSTDPVTGRVDVPKFVSLLLSLGPKSEAFGGKNSSYRSMTLKKTDPIRKRTEVELSEQINSGANEMGVTQLIFYARMTLTFSHNLNSTVSDVANVEMPRHSVKEWNRHPGDEFRRFLLAHPHLLWEDLPFQFYTPETWHSLDAKLIIVAPDVRSMPE